MSDFITNIYQCPSHVCEIFLARSKWITANIQRNDKDEKTLANDIFQYLDGEFSIQPQDRRHIKEYLLYDYWQSTKALYMAEDAKLYLIQAFQRLITCAGQNATNVSNRLEYKAVKRSTSVEVPRVDHDEYMNEVAKVHRSLMDCSKILEQIEVNVQNNSAIGDRGRLVSRAFKSKKLQSKISYQLPVEMDVVTISSEYTETRKAIFGNFKKQFEDLRENLKLLYSCIEKWKESHKKAYIKVGHEFNTDVLKDGCIEACKLILKMIGLLNKDVYKGMVLCADITDQPPLDQEPASHDRIEKLLEEDFKELFRRCFVVNVEPTDVQKVTGNAGPGEKGGKKGKGKGKAGVTAQEVKSNKCGPEFNVSVIILCGRGLECISAVMKPVKANLYYEDNQNKGENWVSGELSVPQVAVDKDGIADFRKQKIINFERPGKNNRTEQVTSERYRIVFETDLSIQNPKITIELKTMSLPMAIITGSNQANSAHGALLWYCYNTNPYLLPTLPVSIPTERFKEMIQACFKYLNGRLLRDDEIVFILAKLFKQDDRHRNEVKFEEFEVTHKAKDDKTIPFWRWLQSILNLIEFFLLKAWQNGAIYGFVSKPDTEELLYDEPDGVFLLRFSESVVIGDGQNKNLTGAIVAAFSRGAGSKPIMSRPLTVESYFKKYSLYAVLSGIQNKNKNRQMLKRLYNTNATIKDFETLYNDFDKKDVAAKNTSYPNWDEQTLLMLTDLDEMELSDDDDDNDEGDNDSVSNESVSYDEIKRKKPKMRYDSMNSSEYSPEPPNDSIPEMKEMRLPPNAVDNLLAKPNFQPSTSMFSNTFSTLPNIPSGFSNNMILPDGTVIDGVTMCSSDFHQQSFSQVPGQINQTSMSFPSPAHSNALSPVHSEIHSPDNTPTHMVLGPPYQTQFDYDDTTWNPPVNAQSSPEDMDSSIIPVPAQELMKLSGPDLM